MTTRPPGYPQTRCAHFLNKHGLFDALTIFLARIYNTNEVEGGFTTSGRLAGEGRTLLHEGGETIVPRCGCWASKRQLRPSIIVLHWRLFGPALSRAAPQEFSRSARRAVRNHSAGVSECENSFEIVLDFRWFLCSCRGCYLYPYNPNLC